MAKKPAKSSKTIEPKIPVKKVALANRKNFPVIVTYNGEQLLIPPKGKTKKEFIEANLSSIDPKVITIVR